MTWARRLKNILLLGAAIAFVIALAGLPLYVFPPAQAATAADVVYVIGPPHEPRLALNRQLRDAGLAEASLISVSPDDPSESRMLQRECDDGTTTCATPEPFTTIGETLLLADYGADSAVVITFTPHVARTRYIFEKCFDGDVTVVGVDADLGVGEWIYQYAYQTGAFVKAFFEQCPS